MQRFLAVMMIMLSLCISCKKQSAETITPPDTVHQTKVNNQSELVIYTEISGMTDGIYDKQNPNGFYGELVIEIQKKLGDNTDIRIAPWARAYDEILKNKNTILFPMNRTPDREGLFIWVGPLMEIRYNLYALKSEGIKIRNLDDAKQFKAIGTVQGDTREDFLKANGFTNLDPTHDNDLNIKKLFANRVQLITGSSVGIGKQINRAGYSMDQIEEVYTLFTGSLYIAFSKDFDKKIVQQWEQAFKELLADGTYQRLYAKWYPSQYMR